MTRGVHHGGMNPIAHLIARDVTRNAVIGATPGPVVPPTARRRLRRPPVPTALSGR